jgi:hypothetical protein
MVTDTARQDVMLSAGLPVLGSLFYFHGKPLAAVAYNVVDTVSPTSHIVEFEYDDVEFEKAESCTLEPEDEQYPLYLPESYVGDIIPNASGNPQVQYKTKWVLKTLKFSNYRQQLAVTVFLRQWGADQRAQILKEMGKIHEFQGFEWLFKGANVDREGEERHRVVYRWLSDPGFDGRQVPDFLESLNSSYIIPRDPTLGSGQDLVRLPFRSYLTVPQVALEDDPGTPTVTENIPKIRIVTSINRNPSGHLGLPGLPIA